jgi:hypothetical protein
MYYVRIDSLTDGQLVDHNLLGRQDAVTVELWNSRDPVQIDRPSPCGEREQAVMIGSVEHAESLCLVPPSNIY